MNDLPRTQSLRCFITVAREGTVSRAASLLNLTQPAVSLQLKGLEESTGLQLFNRTPGGFTLTEAGAALLPLAHKAVAASSDFRTMAGSRPRRINDCSTTSSARWDRFRSASPLPTRKKP
jgi:DNA-binding transcriptional LysR family regulator